MYMKRRRDLGFTCKDCPDRYPGCHGKCEKYQSEKEAWNKRNAELNKNKDVDYYILNNISKNKDRKEKKRRDTKGYHKFND